METAASVLTFLNIFRTLLTASLGKERSRAKYGSA